MMKWIKQIESDGFENEKDKISHNKEDKVSQHEKLKLSQNKEKNVFIS